MGQIGQPTKEIYVEPLELPVPSRAPVKPEQEKPVVVPA